MHMIKLATCTLTLAVTACATTPVQESLSGGLFGEGLTGARLDATVARAATSPFGSKENPVRANRPEGQRVYLGRLRCSDGNAPTFSRGGSVGTGPYGTMLDVYDVRCASGQPATTAVYMDMYHAHVELRAVPGFTIVGATGAR